MQPLTGYPVFSLQLRRSCHPTTNGRHRNMRMRLKDINWSIKRLADGTTKTYYYAWRGGPRIDAEPGTPEFVRLYNEAVATLNGRAPLDMEDFVRALSSAHGVVEITTTSGGMIMLDAEEVRKSTPRILARYHIPRDRTASLPGSSPPPLRAMP